MPAHIIFLLLPIAPGSVSSLSFPSLFPFFFSLFTTRQLRDRCGVERAHLLQRTHDELVAIAAAAAHARADRQARAAVAAAETRIVAERERSDARELELGTRAYFDLRSNPFPLAC